MIRSRETLIGALVISSLVAAFAFKAADKGRQDSGGYALSATFSKADGLPSGAEVRLAGLPVGSVISQTLDDKFRAHVVLRLNAGVRVPADSAAVIETDGLLGTKYVEIQPGGEDEYLQAGQSFEYAQGSLLIEELLGRILGLARQRLSATPPPPSPATTNTEGLPTAPSPLDTIENHPEGDETPDSRLDEDGQGTQN